MITPGVAMLILLAHRAAPGNGVPGFVLPIGSGPVEKTATLLRWYILNNSQRA